MFRKRTERLLSGMGIDPSVVAKARGVMQPGVLQEAAQRGALVQRLAAMGFETAATVRGFTTGAAGPGSHVVHLELIVEPPDGEPYGTSIDQALPDRIVTTLAAGQRVTVKVAHDDPHVLMLWNTPHAPGGADPDTGRRLAAGDDRIERLEELARLRVSGAISDEELHARKADILGS
jgi:hypothetical protein